MANLKKRTNPRKKGNEKKGDKKGFLWPRTIYFLCLKYTHWGISGYFLLFVAILKNVRKKIKTEFGCLTLLQTPNQNRILLLPIHLTDSGIC